MLIPVSIARSGTIASGQVGWPHVSSGAIIAADPASGVSVRYTAPVYSGLTTAAVITGEIISGVRAVNISLSGSLVVAMASIPSRMPAVGVVLDNVASGIQANVFTLGMFQLTSGMADYSGNLGQYLYVGRSGQIVTASGSFNSGGFSSGDIYQSIGMAVNSGMPMIDVATLLPFVVTFVYASDIASGGVQGYYGTYRNVSSGTVGYYDFGSGTIISRSTEVTPIVSGSYGATPSLITAEPISGVKAVSVDTGGNLRIAMAAISGRMPAIGVVKANVASGIGANVHVVGFVQYLSAGSGQPCDFSGQIGRRIWVGMSGDLVTSSGLLWAGTGSGGWLSGSYMQNLGRVVNSGGVVLNIDSSAFSGSISSGASTTFGQVGLL